MVKIKISYEEKDHKEVHETIEQMKAVFKNVKVEHEYKDPKGHKRIHINAR